MKSTRAGKKRRACQKKNFLGAPVRAPSLLRLKWRWKVGVKIERSCLVVAGYLWKAGEVNKGWKEVLCCQHKKLHQRVVSDSFQLTQKVLGVLVQSFKDFFSF